MRSLRYFKSASAGHGEDDAKQMLMWGPLKDTVKEGFSVRRQAEKQQTVYRLILLCAPKLGAASCKDPPPSLFFLCASPHLTFLAFLAAVSGMGYSLNRNRFVSFSIVLFHRTHECSHSSIYVLLHSALCLCIACPFPSSLANTLYKSDKRRFTFSHFLQTFWLVSQVHLSELTAFTLG